MFEKLKKLINKPIKVKIDTLVSAAWVAGVFTGIFILVASITLTALDHVIEGKKSLQDVAFGIHKLYEKLDAKPARPDIGKGSDVFTINRNMTGKVIDVNCERLKDMCQYLVTFSMGKDIPPVTFWFNADSVMDKDFFNEISGYVGSK